MARACADELLAGVQQVAHLLGLGIRDEAAPDPAMCQQIRKPGCGVHVGLNGKRGGKRGR